MVGTTDHVAAGALAPQSANDQCAERRTSPHAQPTLFAAGQPDDRGLVEAQESAKQGAHIVAIHGIGNPYLPRIRPGRIEG